MDVKLIYVIDTIMNIILVSISTLQKITNKSEEEIFQMIREESKKTDALINQLK